MRRFLRTLGVWALFVLVGPLGGLALFLIAGASMSLAAGQDSLPVLGDGQTMLSALGLAYVLGAPPLLVAGFISAVASSFTRSGWLWLILAMLTATACMWVVLASIMNAAGSYTLNASLIFSLSGTASGLLAGLLSLPFRPRPRTRFVEERPAKVEQAEASDVPS